MGQASAFGKLQLHSRPLVLFCFATSRHILPSTAAWRCSWCQPPMSNLPTKACTHIMQKIEGALGRRSIVGDQRQAAHALAVQTHVL